MNPKSEKGFFALMLVLSVFIVGLLFVSKLLQNSPSQVNTSTTQNVVDFSDWKIIEEPASGLSALCKSTAEVQANNYIINCTSSQDTSPLIIAVGEPVSQTEFFEKAREAGMSIGQVGSEQTGRYWTDSVRSEKFQTKNGYDAAIFQYKQRITLEDGKTMLGNSPLVFALRTPTHDSPSRMTFVYFQTPWNQESGVLNEEEILRKVVDSIGAPTAKTK